MSVDPPVPDASSRDSFILHLELASSPLHILDNSSHIELTLSSQGMRKRLMGHPLAARPRRRLLHHLINLLKRQPLSLRNQKVRIHKRRRAKPAPNKEHGTLEVALVLVNHVRGDDSDDGVPEPIGSGGKSDAAGSDGQGEDLADDDPGAGTPGAGEEEDVDGDEGDLGVYGGGVVGDGVAGGVEVGVVEADGDTDDCLVLSVFAFACVCG